jgi:hypothetical protein
MACSLDTRGAGTGEVLAGKPACAEAAAGAMMATAANPMIKRLFMVCSLKNPKS